jgi:uncharacterized protein (DUF1501 family)
MEELDSSLSEFCADLRAQKNLDWVVVMGFSEFSCLVHENARGGTDHGAVALLFVVGGKFKAGFYGAAPGLLQLHDGDIIHSVDFRSVYATI